MIRQSLACGVAATLILTGGSQAAMVLGDSADANTQDGDYDGTPNNATKDQSFKELVVGEQGGVRTAVFPFLLPDNVDDAGSNPIASATLTIELQQKRGSDLSNYNADLYGLGRTSTSADPASSDHFVGALDASNTRLEDNFSTNSDATGPKNETGTQLVTFLNSQISTTNVGDGSTYLFFRLNPDASNANFNGSDGDGIDYGGSYDFVSADDANAGLQNPVLNFTLVPEPASLALLGVGGLMIFSRRRERGSA